MASAILVPRNITAKTELHSGSLPVTLNSKDEGSIQLESRVAEVIDVFCWEVWRIMGKMVALRFMSLHSKMKESIEPTLK